MIPTIEHLCKEILFPTAWNLILALFNQKYVFTIREVKFCFVSKEFVRQFTLFGASTNKQTVSFIVYSSHARAPQLKKHDTQSKKKIINSQGHSYSYRMLYIHVLVHTYISNFLTILSAAGIRGGRCHWRKMQNVPYALLTFMNLCIEHARLMRKKIII